MSSVNRPACAPHGPGGNGRSFIRGDAVYEGARCGTLWRTNVPDRFPDRIVQANALDDEAAMTATAEPGLGGSDLIAVSESPPLAHGNTILVSYGNVPHAPH